MKEYFTKINKQSGREEYLCTEISIALPKIARQKILYWKIFIAIPRLIFHIKSLNILHILSKFASTRKENLRVFVDGVMHSLKCIAKYGPLKLNNLQAESTWTIDLWGRMQRARS